MTTLYNVYINVPRSGMITSWRGNLMITAGWPNCRSRQTRYGCRTSCSIIGLLMIIIWQLEQCTISIKFELINCNIIKDAYLGSIKSTDADVPWYKNRPNVVEITRNHTKFSQFGDNLFGILRKDHSHYNSVPRKYLSSICISPLMTHVLL